MKRIVIGCSPRTGSTMLLKGLEAHSAAVSCGEVAYRGQVPNWNIAKLFGSDSEHDCFEPCLENSYLIYLYREDITRQLLSWKRACESGVWSEFGYIDPIEFTQEQMLDVIAKAETVFFARADYVISYEGLCAEWDRHVWEIQTEAGWPVESVKVQTRKTGEYPQPTQKFFYD